MDLSDITRLISSLRAQTARDSITPNGLGSILQRIVDAISSMSGIDVEDEEAILQRLSAAESNASTALQAAQNAQAGAAGNVIDSFTHSQDEDEVSLSIKQHGHSAKQVVLPAASSTGAGIMTATDKSHLDTAYGKRVNLMSAPSSESVVTLTITFGDGTTKSVTFVGATAGTGGKAGLMTKEQADQLAALVAAGPAESVRDDAGYLKQQYAAPIILRNVTDTVFDDLNIGDVYYDTGHLFYHAEGTSGDPDIGEPSRKVIYYCLADQTLYRWTGSRFVQAVSISSGDVTVPTKLSDLINDMGFLTAHQPLKTINGQTITGTGNITIDGAAELKDASNHVKQSMATPVVLRNVTATVFDDLNEGDTYFDSGHLFYHTEGTSGDIDLGTPSKRLIYFSIANRNFYRWTGSSFTQIAAGGSSSEILALNGVSTSQDGTIVFTDTAGDTYTVNLNHTHPNMAKLIVCEESDLPSTLDNSTIYAITDSGETEIEKLIIRGMEFAGGGVPDTGEPMISSPSNGSTINLGTNEGSGVSKTITIKGKNLTGDLTVAVGTGLTISYGQSTGQSSVTIPMAQALLGAQVTIAYSGSGALDDGSLVISHGGSVLSSVVVVVVVPVPVDLAAVKLTGVQWLETDYYPNPNTEFELDMQLVANSRSNETSDPPSGPCPYFLACAHEGNNRFNFLVGTPPAGSKEIACYNNVVGTRLTITYNNADDRLNRSVLYYVKNGSSMSMTFNGMTGTTGMKTNTMLSKLAIGYSYYYDLPFNRFDLVIFGFKIKENGVTVKDYRPAMFNGVPGLYDYENDDFISSKTSTELVAISTE